MDLASPWIIYQVCAFISPGLYKKERRWALPFVLITGRLQKRQPPFPSVTPPSNTSQIAGNTAFGNDKAEFLQLTMNLGRALPMTVLGFTMRRTSVQRDQQRRRTVGSCDTTGRSASVFHLFIALILLFAAPRESPV
jgi:hypothetical protein